MEQMARREDGDVFGVSGQKAIYTTVSCFENILRMKDLMMTDC